MIRCRVPVKKLLKSLKLLKPRAARRPRGAITPQSKDFAPQNGAFGWGMPTTA